MRKGMLPKELKIIPPQTFCIALSMKKYFLKDPRADLFINVNDKIFPVHRSQFQSIHYFQKLPKYEKIHIIHERFNVDMFQKMLAYFYGEKLVVKTFQQLQQLFMICQFLQIQFIPDQIQQILLKNNTQHEMDIFILLQLSYDHNLHQIFKTGTILTDQLQQIFGYFKQLLGGTIDLKTQIEILQELILKLSNRKHKIQHDIYLRLIEKYSQAEPNCLQTLNDRSPLLRSKKGTIQSAQIQSSPFNSLSEENSEVILKVPLRESARQRKKMRKFSDSDHCENSKFSMLNNQATNKIHVSGKLNTNLNVFDEAKIQQQKDEDIIVPEKLQSPKIRIKSIKKPSFQSKSFQLVQCEISEPKQTQKQQQKALGTINSPLLSLLFLSNSQQKIQANPDNFMNKVSQLLQHYQDAYELHESNILTIKNKLKKTSAIQQQNDEDRRLSAGPMKTYDRKISLGTQTRLVSTVKLINNLSQK